MQCASILLRNDRVFFPFAVPGVLLADDAAASPTDRITAPQERLDALSKIVNTQIQAIIE